MTQLLSLLFAPGFFQNTQVLRALLAGGIVAAISGVVGVFVVIRGQLFTGHAIADFGGAGAAIAFLMRINTLWGFLIFGVLAAIGVDLLDSRTTKRDMATGVILSVALGIESLFLYLDTYLTSQSGAPMQILFGSIFMLSPSTATVVGILTVAVAIILCLIYRPLLFCSVDPELAQTRGVPVRAVSLIFIVVLSLTVEEASLTTGALLSTALLIGPAAAAMHLTHDMGRAALWAACLGILATWAGIVLAYDSFLWPPTGHGWPVSFFVCTLILLFYLLARFHGRHPHGGHAAARSVVRND